MRQTKNSSAEIPIFPLPLVAFPTAYVPLHIFEPRYKRMVKDVLLADQKFGIVRVDESTGRLSKVGCLVEILAVEPLEDERMNIMTVGRQRFQIVDLIDDKPYRQAQVKLLSESLGDSYNKFLAKQLLRVIEDISTLSAKVSECDDMPTNIAQQVPPNPTDLSFWVPIWLYGSTAEQQRILEMETVMERLESELYLLDETKKKLAAMSALKSAFR